MPVTLANNLYKLQDLSPIVRNTNDGGVISDKAGPQGIAKFGSQYWMFFEAVDDTIIGSGAFDNSIGPMLAKASQLQGTWTISPSSLLISPNTGTWENGEFSPSSVLWDRPNNRWIMWAHGGNNTGPRKIGVAYSTDGSTGQAWTRESGNPILSIGTSGAFDDASVADLKIQRIPDGTYLGFYRGTKTSTGVFSVGRVTGSSPNNLTKTGQVIAGGGVGSWNVSGTCPGMWWLDPENRLHMFAATLDNGIGYFYSDDYGVTFTAYGSNPVLGPGGAGSADPLAGDVTQGIYDGGILFVTYGGENITDYPTNPPLRGIVAAITPARVTNPTKKARFYLNDATAARTSVTGTSPLSQTVFSVMGRFRAFRLDRDAPQQRTLYTEYAAFNIQIFNRVEGGSGADAGKFRGFFRTPTAIADLVSATTYDDGAWHVWLVRRISTSSWELWVDGVLADTDATNISTDATATAKAVGNWDPSGGVDEPSLCTISDLVTVNGTAVTWDQALLIVTQRIYPSGVSATIDFPASGTDSGSAVTVDGAIVGGERVARLSNPSHRPAPFKPGLAR